MTTKQMVAKRAWNMTDSASVRVAELRRGRYEEEKFAVSTEDIGKLKIVASLLDQAKVLLQEVHDG